MAKILITSGPTRQYLDPVRFLTNGSSGKMGGALAQAVLDAGHEAVVISGPVSVRYPEAAAVVFVKTTEEMLAAALEHFPRCIGAIAAAAPCDFRPKELQTQKIRKTGLHLTVELIETPDVIGALGRRKRADQWTVAFALETEEGMARAMAKLRTKQADLIVVNQPNAIDSDSSSVQILGLDGAIVGASGPKTSVAQAILERIQQSLIK